MNLQILEKLKDELEELSQFTGAISIAGDVLNVCDSNLRIKVSLDESEHQDPRFLHCHIISQLGSDTSENLDACIVGLGNTPDGQITEAAKTWVGMVGAPILSLLNQASILGAEHFTEESDFGVPQAHGFVGPRMCRAFPDDFDFDAIQDCNLFEGVDAMAPPEPLQLVKIVLNADDGRWIRHIEINGHAISYVEDNYDFKLKAPKFGTITQFAIFHFAGNQEWIDQQQKMDNAICHFVASFSETQDIEKSLAKMSSLGLDDETIYQVHMFTSLAFSRFLFADLGANYSNHFDRILSGGDVKHESLIQQPAYARSFLLCPEFQAGELFNSFQTIALLNNEFNSLNEKLNEGMEPKQVFLPNPVIPDFGIDEDSIAYGSKKILKQREKKSSS